MNLIERLNNFVIESKKQNTRISKNFYCSALSNCSRRLFYDKLGTAKDPSNITGLSIRRMDVGSAIHSLYQDYLVKAGLVASQDDIEVSIKDLEYRISGRMDGILTDPVLLEKCVLEIKSVGTVDNANSLPYDSHLDQIQVYMHLTKIHKGKLLYIFLDKREKPINYKGNYPYVSDCDILEIDVTYDPEYVKKIYVKIKNIIDSLDKKTPPHALYGSQSDCKWCEFVSTCKKGDNVTNTYDLSSIFGVSYGKN